MDATSLFPLIRQLAEQFAQGMGISLKQVQPAAFLQWLLQTYQQFTPEQISELCRRSETDREQYAVAIRLLTQEVLFVTDLWQYWPLVVYNEELSVSADRVIQTLLIRDERQNWRAVIARTADAAMRYQFLLTQMTQRLQMLSDKTELTESEATEKENLSRELPVYERIVSSLQNMYTCGEVWRNAHSLTWQTWLAELQASEPFGGAEPFQLLREDAVVVQRLLATAAELPHLSANQSNCLRLFSQLAGAMALEPDDLQQLSQDSYSSSV